MTLHPVLKEVLLSEQQINDRTKELANEIEKFYLNKNGYKKPIVLLGLLKGCVPFMANFMKNFDYPCTTEYMVVSSYGNASESNKVPQILLDINNNIEGKDVLVIEDIIDSGYTLEFIQKHVINRGAKSVKILSLLDKYERREVKVDVNWIGFKVEDNFLVGFGLDYAQKFRQLPYVASVDLEKFDKYDWSQEE